jgi:hypothetical protein
MKLLTTSFIVENLINTIQTWIKQQATTKATTAKYKRTIKILTGF